MVDPVYLMNSQPPSESEVSSTFIVITPTES